MAGTKLGNLRAYWLGAVVCLGGFVSLPHARSVFTRL